MGLRLTQNTDGELTPYDPLQVKWKTERNRWDHILAVSPFATSPCNHLWNLNRSTPAEFHRELQSSRLSQSGPYL